MKLLVRTVAVMAAATLSIGADAPKSNWTTTVSVQEDGSHVLGNPRAEVKLTEFVSYTCPHCATFHNQSDATLKLGYVMPGKASVRIQHFVRDPVDLTAAMLTNCGDPKSFFVLHNAFMASQGKWLAKLDAMSAAQKQRWNSGPTPARLKAITADFNFYEIMERRGFNRVQVDRCLGDDVQAQKLAKQTQSAVELGVEGTPSFALNGELLDNVHDWIGLDKRLREAL